ncbi:SMP-30/gluconolactonase/LRE family protein [Paracoccus sp. (in: a-proteobacteria)]|uniref:SMP-30/gluconolactonase/LRE family protein n=1 Tax=Paracoccus sp. TaxID=267 RepID=UPI003A83DF7D
MQERETRILAEGYRFLEAPKWHEGRLWMSDVFDARLVSVTLSGEKSVVCEVPGLPAGQDFLPDGSHITISAKERRLYRVADGRLHPYADLSDLAAGRLNDFAVDARGRIYVGDFGYDYHAGESPRPARLYRVDPDGSVRVAAENVEFPNGSVVVNEGRTLIVAETWVGRIRAFDLSPDGQLGDSRIFADLGERNPDGLCADRDNAIWVCSFNTGEVLRVIKGGKISDRIRIDGAAISCTLGGTDGRTLFITCVMGEVDESESPDAPRNSAVLMARVDVPGQVSRGV